MKSISVLLTTFNRREATLFCLRSLYDQSAVRLGKVELQTYIVDAGSSDGTREAIGQEFPDAYVVEVGSDVYWAQGMRRGQEISRQSSDSDYEFWVNDDVVLKEEALEALLDVSSQQEDLAVVVGATCNGDGVFSYGGFNKGPAWNRLRLSRVEPNQDAPPRFVDTFNGNLVLIPSAVGDRIGLISKHFVHGMADVDYGFRAGEAGFRILLASDYLGICSENPPATRASGVMNELRRLAGPKALPPRSWFELTQKHAGILWPFTFVRPYLGAMSCSRSPFHLRGRFSDVD